MTASPETRPLLGIEDYLEGEQLSEVRHEYLAGEVYAMAGASAVHNIISLNLAAALHEHLRSGPCQAFMAEMKVRLSIAEDVFFYYPDLMVACDPTDNAPFFRERPAVIIEVLSPATERLDRREKFLAYQTIRQLENYVLIDQERIACTLFRRGETWKSQVLTGPEEQLVLSRIDFQIPLRRIYERTGLLPK